MQKSDFRILTTHVGSIPRNPTLTAHLLRQEQGEAVDVTELDRQVKTALQHVIRKQLESGVLLLDTFGVIGSRRTQIFCWG